MLTKADLGKILGCNFGLGSVLLEGSHKGHFVLLGLEATMTHLGAGVDELEADLLQGLFLAWMRRDFLRVRTCFLVQCSNPSGG